MTKSKNEREVNLIIKNKNKRHRRSNAPFPSQVFPKGFPPPVCVHVRLRMFTCTSQECQRSRHSSARCDLPDGTHDRRKGCVQGREEGGGREAVGKGHVGRGRGRGKEGDMGRRREGGRRKEQTGKGGGGG